VYTQKTEFLKEMFEDVIGPGSYFRFEGKSDEGVWYYCILGPAQVHKPRAKFFAGVRRLPATYSAGGKYFDSLSAAAEYAKEHPDVPWKLIIYGLVISILAPIAIVVFKLIVIIVLLTREWLANRRGE
jgi:hypothetical protein